MRLAVQHKFRKITDPSEYRTFYVVIVNQVVNCSATRQNGMTHTENHVIIKMKKHPKKC